MKFSDYLIAESKEYWDKAVENDFVTGVVNGTLDKKVFANYLLQDYAFVGSFLDLVSYCICYSKTVEQKHRLATFLSIATSDEDDFFIRSFKELGVPESDYEDFNITPSNAIKGFGENIKRAIKTVETKPALAYAACITVLASAEMVYFEWANHYKDKKPHQFYFNEWILLHNNPEFTEFVAWLREEVNHFEHFSTEDKEYLLSLFKRSSELEYLFFEEAYQ